MAKTAVLTPEASAIESAVAQNKTIAAALIEAELKANTLAIAVDEADLAVDAISDSWDQGDDSVSAEAYSLAQIEHKRAISLSEAAQRSVTNLQHSFINVDKDLAELVAVWVEAANPGVPVLASITLPAAPSALPAAYVIQTSKTDVGRGGVIAGRCDITYFRTPLHREFNCGAIEHQASLAGCSITAGGRVGLTSGNGVTSDWAAVTVRYGHTVNPVMGEPTEAIARDLAQSLTTELAASTDPGQPLHMVEGGGMTNEYVTVKSSGATVVKTAVDDAGQRTSEVQVKLTYWRHGARDLSGSMNTRLRSMVEGRPGTFSPGLGVCQSAETAGIDSPDYSGLTNVTLLLTFTSASR